MKPRLGSRVRSHRRKRQITQVELARRLGISASYLNLIEHNQRSLTAPLLLKVAEEFQLDFREFAGDADSRLVADLIEIFADPMFENAGLTAADMHELASDAPAIARAVRQMYTALQHTRDSTTSLAQQIYSSQEIPGAPARLASEDVTEVIQRHQNHFPSLEKVAEALSSSAGLDDRDMFAGLASHLKNTHDIDVHLATETAALRRYDPDKRRVSISRMLPRNSRVFQLAAQVGLIDHREELDELASGQEELLTDESRALFRVVLANYFAGAVMMPYAELLKAAIQERYDIELVSHRFGASYEQVCHRFTTLRRPGAEGVPFHMIRVDLAGNISKRFTASGIRFARFSGACPRWNVFPAFLTPGLMRVQISHHAKRGLLFLRGPHGPQRPGGLPYSAHNPGHWPGLPPGGRQEACLLRRRGPRDARSGHPRGRHLSAVRTHGLRAASLPISEQAAADQGERARRVVLHPRRRVTWRHSRRRRWRGPGSEAREEIPDGRRCEAGPLVFTGMFAPVHGIPAIAALIGLAR